MKKKANLIEEIKDLYYTKGSELGTSKALLDYVWEVQFKRQFGYSFSQNHTLPYSGICLQEMNLAHRYGKIYWNTAVLTINAGANENTENNKSTNYGKIAKAIGNIKSRGETVALPEINSAKFEFSPDRKHNRIIFGLKGIIGINDDIAKAIIDHRPYTSFKDFHQKMVNYKLSTKDDPEKKNKFGDTVFANLIKAGCFDELEERSRKDILTEFIWEICEPLKAIHMSSIKTLKDLKFLTPEQEAFEVRLQGFREYVYSKQFLVTQGKSPATNYYKLEHRFAEPYFLEHLENKLTLDKDYYYSEDGFIIVKRGAMDREIDKILAPFKEKVLNSKEALDIVNQDRFQKAWDKYVEGDISKWEMDSLCFYYTSHEMENLKESKYNIRNFFDMPTTGVVVDKYYYRGVEKPRFELSRIAGTVLDKDKNKHIVTLLTKYGVVNIKFYKGQFGFYDKQVSTINPDGSKTIDEKSWFKRGTKLLITGYRREDQFVPKKYSDTIYNHTVQMITNIKDNGEIVIKTEREGAEDE